MGSNHRLLSRPVSVRRVDDLSSEELDHTTQQRTDRGDSTAATGSKSPSSVRRLIIPLAWQTPASRHHPEPRCAPPIPPSHSPSLSQERETGRGRKGGSHLFLGTCRARCRPNATAPTQLRSVLIQVQFLRVYARTFPDRKATAFSNRPTVEKTSLFTSQTLRESTSQSREMRSHTKCAESHLRTLRCRLWM